SSQSCERARYLSQFAGDFKRKASGSRGFFLCSLKSHARQSRLPTTSGRSCIAAESGGAPKGAVCLDGQSRPVPYISSFGFGGGGTARLRSLSPPTAFS